MTSFRLARLLRLRERQEREEKLLWAAASRNVQVAAERREVCRAALERAYAELADGLAVPGPDPGTAARAALAAHRAIDALVERKSDQEASLQGARRLAAEARIPYDAKRREVEALKRLEQRWQRERRRKRRRREERDRQEHIARTGATNR